MLHHLDVKDLSAVDIYEGYFDAIVCCSGYEERSRYLAKQLLKHSPNIPTDRYYIPFKDFPDHPERRKNDIFFQKFGYKPFDVEYDNFGSISERLARLVSQREEVKLLIDYSAMKRTMYAEILQFISSHQFGCKLSVTFSYSVGIPSGEYQPKIISDYVLLPGFEGDTNSQREKFAVYSLGFEPVILHSIHEWIEPSASVAFYADPGVQDGSGKRCLKLNRRFLDGNDCRAVPQSLFSVENYCRTFTETVKAVMRDRDVIVFSGGPKPFVLGALLTSSPSCQPSHVYARGEESRAIDTKPTGKLVVSSVKRS